jgi:hypothetical protein
VAKRPGSQWGKGRWGQSLRLLQRGQKSREQWRGIRVVSQGVEEIGRDPQGLEVSRFGVL